MSNNPYTPPIATEANPKKSPLSIINLIISWVLWLVCAFYFLGVAAIRFYPKFIANDPLKPTESLSITFMGLGVIAFAFLLLWIRRAVWFKKGKSPRFGYMAYQFPLYFAVLTAIAAPTLGVFMELSGGFLFQFGIVLTLILMVLAFPRIPKAPAEN